MGISFSLSPRPFIHDLDIATPSNVGSKQHPISKLRTPQSPTLHKTLIELGLEELSNTNVLTEALASPRLQHKVARRSLRIGSLQRP